MTTPQPEAARKAGQQAFDVIKRCTHTMEHAEIEETACACHACITTALTRARKEVREQAINCIEQRKAILISETGDGSYQIVRQLELVRDAIRRQGGTK